MGWIRVPFQKWFMFNDGVMSTTQRHLSDKPHQWMLFQIMIKGYKWFWHCKNIKLLFVIILDEWIGHINKHTYATIERHVAETKEGITKGCNILDWYIGLVATVAKTLHRPHQSDELLKLDRGIKPVLISSIYYEGYIISYGGYFQWYHINRRPHHPIIVGNSNDGIGSLNEALKYSEVVIRSRFSLPKDEILPVIIGCSWTVCCCVRCKSKKIDVQLTPVVLLCTICDTILTALSCWMCIFMCWKNIFQFVKFSAWLDLIQTRTRCCQTNLTEHCSFNIL